jgi:hypothetical protein
VTATEAVKASAMALATLLMDLGTPASFRFEYPLVQERRQSPSRLTAQGKNLCCAAPVG